MGGQPQLAAAGAEHYAGGQQALLHRQRVAARQLERNDARAMRAIAMAGDRGARLGEPLAGQIGQLEDPPGDGRRAELQQQIEAGGEAQEAGHVLRTTFVAGGGGLEIQLDVAVIAALHDAVPADADGPQQVEMLAPQVEHTGALRPQQPLVAVGRQEVDRRFLHVQRKDAQALNGVEAQQGPAVACQRDQLVQIRAPSAGISDPTDRQDPRARVAGRRQTVDIDSAVRRLDASRFDAARREVEPRILVGGKLVVERDDVVAFAPGIPFSDQGDALGRAVGQRYFGGVGADQACGQRAALLDAPAPPWPYGVAFFECLARPGNDRLVRAPRQRRDGRMVEVGPFGRHRHLAAKALPAVRRGGWFVGHGALGCCGRSSQRDQLTPSARFGQATREELFCRILAGIRPPERELY